MTRQSSPSETVPFAGSAAFRAASANAMTEKTLQENVRRLALALSYRFFHVLRPKGSPAGWPDCAMVRHGRFLVAELKTEKGALTDAQKDWLADLAVAGVECHVWRPSHWYDGTVERTLR